MTQQPWWHCRLFDSLISWRRDILSLFDVLRVNLPCLFARRFKLVFTSPILLIECDPKGVRESIQNQRLIFQIWVAESK